MIIYYEEIDYLKDKNKFDLKVKNSVHEFINIVNKKEIKIDIKNNS